MSGDLDDEVYLAIERRSREQFERVLAFFAEIGRPEMAEELKARLRDIELGIDSARGTWHALSAPQRRVLESLGEGRALHRASASRSRYDAINVDRREDLDSDFNICGLPTARCLCTRELIVVAGGALDPERKFVITERGQFILQHGPKHP